MWHTSSQASRILQVHPNTLRKWADDGLITTRKTPGGHRRYDVDSIRSWGTKKKEKKHTTGKVDYIYARVSSSKQKEDLERQIAFMQERFPTYEVIKDIGSGLNYERKGFQRLLGSVMQGYVGTIAIAERDRLCRFGYDLCAFICDTFGTTIRVEHTENSQTPSDEMVQDVMSILHVFSAKMCGRRRYPSSVATDLQRRRKRSRNPAVDRGTPPEKRLRGDRATEVADQPREMEKIKGQEQVKDPTHDGSDHSIVAPVEVTGGIICHQHPTDPNGQSAHVAFCSTSLNAQDMDREMSRDRE